MTSTNFLPVDLLSILLPFTEPFQATSARFYSHLSGEETFPRVCELHNTLDLLAESKKPMSHLWNLRGGRKGDTPSSTNSNKDAEDLLSFMLNSEFVLYELYREYEVSLNPSLAHWVGICREFDKYTREHAESNAEWGLRERVLKIRAAFVKGILGEQGPHLAKFTPQDFAIKGLDFNVNLDSFREALRNQGIYEAEEDAEKEKEKEEAEEGEGEGAVAMEERKEGADGLAGQLQQPEAEVFPDSDRYSQTSFVRSEKTQTPVAPATPTVRQEAQAQIASIIFQASAEELSADLTDRLLSHLSSAPELLASYPLELMANSTLAGLFNANPTLTRGLVSLFLAHGSKLQRRQMITALQFLPITLGSLEMLNDLVSKTTLLTNDETLLVVHGVLTNGMRRAEAMGGGIDDGGRGGQAQAQNRLIRLLCLFLQSVLRCEAVGLPDVYYLVQDLSQFMYVKEARDLWRAYCAS